MMDDVAQVFDGQLKHVARRGKRGLYPICVDQRASVAAERLQVELHSDELVDQGAKAHMIFSIARSFCLFWHHSDLRSAAGR